MHWIHVGMHTVIFENASFRQICFCISFWFISEIYREIIQTIIMRMYINFKYHCSFNLNMLKIVRFFYTSNKKQVSIQQSSEYPRWKQEKTW